MYSEYYDIIRMFRLVSQFVCDCEMHFLQN